MRIAVTGGIAEGKSTVLRMAADLGARTASSDIIAREVFQRPGIQRELAHIAGLPGDAISPAEMRAAMLESDNVRRRLNRVMHPAIRAAMDASDALLHEVPLLIEACLQRRYDRIWVVTCGPAEQFRRLRARLGDAEAATQLIRSQLPTQVKAAFADDVIVTNGSLEAVEAQVRALILPHIS